MALDQTQQIKKLLEDNKHILITFGSGDSGDSVGAALGLSSYLKKLGKRVDIVSDGFELPRQLKFLKNSERIASHFSHLQKFIITVDVKEAGLQELSYDVKDGKLRIFVTPKKGFFTKDKLRTAQSDFKYDLIIVLSTPDLESLGRVYDNHVELFYKVPIINIDRKPTNEHFGQINMVDLTSTTTAEVVFDLIQKLGNEHIDEEISTALLTSIISNTRSFKADNIKPQTLNTASKLIGHGADRDFVVKNLFHTRSISALKLWGQALTNLQQDEELGLVYTSVTRDDISRTSTDKHDIPEIIDELISNSPEAKITLLLFEDPDRNEEYIVHGKLVTDRGYNALHLINSYNPTGSSNYASFTTRGIPLRQLQKDIHATLRKQLKK